ncbi:MAG TPA: choice-of-anchor J domain-containing protein, partial [Chryseolinea sp.]|nr:choice-of-anchor J domain-containing protein [Chryseolinea sp.]
HPRVTCDVVSMFQNYLDYTNDVCMNLFTHGQVDRMQTVIDNSPRRATLPSSHGLLLPLPVVNDLGIKSIVRPGEGECSGNFNPVVEVRNYGSNVINSAKVRLTKDGATIETKDVVFSPALGLLEFTNVPFSSINLASGLHNVKFEILLTNGASDGQTSNNISSQDVEIPEDISLPFIETFNTLPAGWNIMNPDQNITWHLAATGNGSNSSLKVDLYNYEDHIGEVDALITPVFDLSTAPAALLKFDVAYAQFQSSNDGLKVILLANCNTDIEAGTKVYSKFGSVLASTAAASDEFTPTSASDWRTEIIDLSAYAGQGNFQLAFVSYNDWGNNIYLDNIGLTTSPIHDIVLKDIIAPSPVTCDNNPNLQLTIRNAGTLISSLKVITTVNGTENVQTVSNLDFPGNTTMSFLLDPLDLSEGTNDISIEITEPDGALDFSPDDNTLALKTVVNSSSDAIPIRENFEDSYDQWTITNPHEGMNWEEATINSNTALYANGYDNSISGDELWLVSPTLDFSSVEGASLFFDQSYGYAEGTSDMLLILASFNCGNTFSDTLYTSSGSGLANGRLSESSWKPAGGDDWVRKSLMLPSLVGHSDVRLAFVFVNDNGNNLYIDNIEFFTSNDPLRIDEVFSVYPNPITAGTARVTFNLPLKSAVEVDFIDGLGKVLTTEKLTDILNQTYSFDMSGSASGTYFVRIITDDKTYYRKIMLIK